MSQLPSPISARVGGDILTSRFVKWDATRQHHLLQAEAADHPIIGISQEGVRSAQIPPDAGGADPEETRAGKDGDTMSYWPIGSKEVMVRSAADFPPGSYCTSDANGAAVVATSGQVAAFISADFGKTGALVAGEVISPFTVP